METLRELRSREADNAAFLRGLLTTGKKSGISSQTMKLVRLALDLAEIGAGRKFYADTMSASGRFRLHTRKRSPRVIRRRFDHAPVCGAKTRKGTPCQCLPVEGRTRCKYHGGLSTGAKTEEGRARIAESNRRRAEKRREIQHNPTP